MKLPSLQDFVFTKKRLTSESSLLWRIFSIRRKMWNTKFVILFLLPTIFVEGKMKEINCQSRKSIFSLNEKFDLINIRPEAGHIVRLRATLLSQWFVSYEVKSKKAKMKLATAGLMCAAGRALDPPAYGSTQHCQ